MISQQKMQRRLIFSTFLFTYEMFETKAEQTNHYVHCKIATKTNGDPPWKDTSEEIGPALE